MVHPYIQAIQSAPNLSDTSKEVYSRHLRKLTEVTGRSLDKIIRKPKSSFARIQEAYSKPTSLRTMVVAIKSVFKHVPAIKCEYPEAWDKWHSIFQTLDSKVTDALMRGEPSERERNNWVHWRDVVAKEEEMSRTQFGSMDHLLLAMYTLVEPARQDYNAVYITSRAPSDSSIGNYIVLPETGNATLVLNEYKTAKKYKTYSRILPDKLTAIIRESLRQHPRRWLFVKDDGEPFAVRATYRNFSNNTLQRIFGRRFSVGLMRHSYISEGIDYASSSPGDLFEAAKHMHHSLEMQQLYRRRVTPTESALPTAVTMLDSTDRDAGKEVTSPLQISKYSGPTSVPRLDDRYAADKTTKKQKKKKKKKTPVALPASTPSYTPTYKPQEFIDLMF